jgi:site-specific DNA-methyltransferase (adenine-specific)
MEDMPLFASVKVATLPYTLHNGDCLDVLKTLPDASVDAVVCDPPYGLEFMGKKFDKLGEGQAQQKWHEAWATEAFRVLKPGGHLLAFGGTRTYHRLASAVEDAGFEIRDSVVWCYGQGFPKSMNLSKAMSKAGKNADSEKWNGWGTALKPAYEPIVVGRRPVEGTIAANVLKHGTGGLNIDGCRVHLRGEENSAIARYKYERLEGNNGWNHVNRGGRFDEQTAASMAMGRWPANLLLSHSRSCVHVDADDDTDLWACVPGCPIRALDAQSGPSGGCAPASGPTLGKLGKHGVYGKAKGENMGAVAFHGKVDGASRFFMRFDPNDAPFIYLPKTSTKERKEGLTERNSHPTLKRVALMSYLCRLVTPPGGVVLDPFMGSGTTGVAALREGFRFIGIEREAGYFAIAEARLDHAAKTKA